MTPEEMEKYQEEIDSLRHERDTLLDANNGFKAGLMRVLGTEHETYNEYLNEIADLKSGRDAMKEVVDAAKGMCQGTDWNGGTHAMLYRKALEEAIKKLDKGKEEIAQLKTYIKAHEDELDRRYASLPDLTELRMNWEKGRNIQAAWRDSYRVYNIIDKIAKQQGWDKEEA